MKLPAVQKETMADVPAEYGDIFDLKANMEGVIPRLPQIAVVHQAQLYKMPDEEKLEEFEAIILDQHPANAWWSKAITETGGGAIPDCFSMNAKMPAENCASAQSDICGTCTHNEFGSDERGKGKACKNMKRFTLLMENSLLPRRLTIPPSSLAFADTYFTQLTDMGLSYRAVVTKFSLKKIEGEFEYSGLVCEKIRVLSKEEMMVVGKLIRQIIEAARGQEIRAEEYATVQPDTGFDPDDIEKTEPAEEQPSAEEKRGGFFSRTKKAEVPSEDIPF